MKNCDQNSYLKPVLLVPESHKSNALYTAKQKGGWVGIIPASPAANKRSMNRQQRGGQKTHHRVTEVPTTRSRVPSVPHSKPPFAPTARKVRNSSNRAEHRNTEEVQPGTVNQLPNWDSFLPSGFSESDRKRSVIKNEESVTWKNRLLRSSVNNGTSPDAHTPGAQTTTARIPAKQTLKSRFSLSRSFSSSSTNDDNSSVSSSGSSSGVTNYSVESFLLKSSSQLEKNAKKKELTLRHPPQVTHRKLVPEPQLRIHRSGSVDIMLPSQSLGRRDSATSDAKQVTRSVGLPPNSPKNSNLQSLSYHSVPESAKATNVSKGEYNDKLDAYFEKQNYTQQCVLDPETPSIKREIPRSSVDLNNEKFTLGFENLDQTRQTTWSDKALGYQGSTTSSLHREPQRAPGRSLQWVRSVQAENRTREQALQKSQQDKSFNHMEDLVRRNDALYKSNIELLEETKRMEERIVALESLRREEIQLSTAPDNSQSSVVDENQIVAQVEADVAEYLLTVGRALEREFAEIIAETKTRNVESMRSSSIQEGGTTFEQFAHFLDKHVEMNVPDSVSSLAMRLSQHDEVRSKLRSLSANVPKRIIERVSELETVIETVWKHFEERDRARKALFQQSIERVKQHARSLFQKSQTEHQKQISTESSKFQQRLQDATTEHERVMKDITRQLHESTENTRQLSREVDIHVREKEKLKTFHQQELQNACESLRLELIRAHAQQRKIDAKAFTTLQDEFSRFKTQAQENTEETQKLSEQMWNTERLEFQSNIRDLEHRIKERNATIKQLEGENDAIIERKVQQIQEEFNKKLDAVHEKARDLEQKHQEQLTHYDSKHKSDTEAIRREAMMQVEMARQEATMCREQLATLTESHEATIKVLKEKHLLRETQLDKQIHELQVALARTNLPRWKEDIVRGNVGTEMKVADLIGLEQPLYSSSVSMRKHRDSISLSSDSEESQLFRDSARRRYRSPRHHDNLGTLSPERVARSKSPVKRSPKSPLIFSPERPELEENSGDAKPSQTLLANPLLMHLSSKCRKLEHEVEEERAMRNSLRASAARPEPSDSIEKEERTFESAKVAAFLSTVTAADVGENSDTSQEHSPSPAPRKQPLPKPTPKKSGAATATTKLEEYLKRQSFDDDERL